MKPSRAQICLPRWAISFVTVSRIASFIKITVKIYVNILRGILIVPFQNLKQEYNNRMQRKKYSKDILIIDPMTVITYLDYWYKNNLDCLHQWDPRLWDKQTLKSMMYNLFGVRWHFFSSKSSWTRETQPNDALRCRLVEFLVFNSAFSRWLSLNSDYYIMTILNFLRSLKKF